MRVKGGRAHCSGCATTTTTRFGAIEPVVPELRSPAIVALWRDGRPSAPREPPPSGRGHVAAARCDPTSRNSHP
eukprot:6807238-Prymnesium_polylepis.1